MREPVFVSHGAPTLVMEDVPARRFLADLLAGAAPRAIVVASAHWATNAPAVDGSARPRTIHDFGSFPRALYSIRYESPGDPALARTVQREMSLAGIEARVVERGLDHGAWVPLLIARPAADVPVLQVALQPGAGTAHHVALGRALARLARDEDVLVLGSGGATHDLSALQPAGAPMSERARAFDDWLADAVERGDEDALVDYRRRAPHAVENHPTEEHFLPLLVAFGAAGPGASGRVLHQSSTFGVLSMAAFAFRRA